MDINVADKFKSYPDKAKSQLMQIRELIFSVAKEEGLGNIVETLKWGEPSYSSKQGSPIRIDWKAKNPQQVSIYFNCQTTLVETFKELYSDTFRFVGNRELAIPLSEVFHRQELEHCISLALRYHQVKHLPLLGS